MNTRVREVDAEPFVSTGHLPPTGRVVQLVDEAHRLFGTNGDGEVSDVYPALARVSPDLFGSASSARPGRSMPWEMPTLSSAS